MFQRASGVLSDSLAGVAEREGRHLLTLSGLLGSSSVLACPDCESVPLLLALARLGWACAECRRYGRLVLVGEDPAEAWTVLELITDGRERE